MIIRILDEGQFDVPDDRRGTIDKLDKSLADSLDAGDDDAFHAALRAVLGEVRSSGKELPQDHLGPSDLLLPHEGASKAEVRQLLAGDREIPG